MSGPADMLADGAFRLATLVAEEISKKTGADKFVTYEVALATAKKWVAAERAAVTDARARAVARVKGKR